MPYRHLPNTDQGRFCALKLCKTKADATLVANRPISPDNFTLLGTTYTAFSAALGARGGSLGGQTGATEDCVTAMNIARQLISHFIQTLNMAIDRHTFPASARAFYLLDVNTNRLPPLSSEADIILWGTRLKDGEAARIAAGGVAIPFPSIEEVNDAYDDFDTKRLAQSSMSETQDSKEEAVALLRPAVDALIKDLWDEIEFAFRKNSASSLRGKAREWGVVYATRPGETPDPSAAVPAKAVITGSSGTDPGRALIDYMATGANLYNVWRKGPSDPDYILVADHTNLLTYETTGLEAGDQLFKVEGINANGTGPLSDVTTLTVV